MCSTVRKFAEELQGNILVVLSQKFTFIAEPWFVKKKKKCKTNKHKMLHVLPLKSQVDHRLMQCYKALQLCIQKIKFVNRRRHSKVSVCYTCNRSWKLCLQYNILYMNATSLTCVVEEL